MVDIPVKVCGEHWSNPQDLRDLFPQDNNIPLVLRVSGEGPSLWATGIVQETQRLCAAHGRAPGTVWIGDWSNRVEEIPFARFNLHSLSHFFWMSDRYRDTEIPSCSDRQWFGYFMGRATLPRARMLWDVSMNHGEHCLLSVMVDSGLDGTIDLGVETLEEWLADIGTEQFDRWRRQCPIASVDGRSVQQQYDPACNTNRDLLAHYDRFRIELVAETYTRGNCFFPTEKTVRPLSQGRGLLIYGPQYFLRRLRDLGFHTWNSIWDETYDDVEGFLRWQLMQTEMSKIQHMDPAQVEHQLQAIHTHNQTVFDQLVRTFRPR